MKTLGTIIGCVCVATVLSQVVGLGYLWSTGVLTAARLQEVRAALTGSNAAEAPEEEADAAQPSLEEVIRERARLSAEFTARDEQLAVFAAMTNDAKAQLAKDLAEFERRKKKFEADLALQRDELTSSATEQARGVLLALPPREAVENLMQLSVEQDVVLLKGMTEKSIAKILKEFSATPEQTERGKKIFEALTKGQPERTLLDGQTAGP
jgi:hypothetical protein